MNGPQPEAGRIVGAGGASGNITTFTALLCAHTPVPGVPAGVLPHAEEVTYRAIME